jgi:hypothetical protein
MDALFTIAGLIVILIVFAALSVAIGADTRDGFADHPAHPIAH